MRKKKGKGFLTRRTGQLYTSSEIKILRKTFRNNSTATVAKQLQRTTSGVQKKANRLSLHKTQKYLRSSRIV